MSSIYKQLSEEDVRIGRESTASSGSKIDKPRFWGIRIAVLGAFLLSLSSLIGAGFLYQSFNQERRQRQAIEAGQQLLQQKSDGFRMEINQYRAEIERMREQLQEYGKIRTDLKADLNKSRAQIAILQKKIQQIEERGNAIEEQALKLRQGEDTAAEESESSGNSSPPPVSTQEATVAGAPHAVKASAVKVSSQAAQTPAVSQSDAAKPPAAKTSQILSLNRKFSFAVVNIGLRDNLKIGDRLSVRQANKEIGMLQVEKLYDHFAAATIVEESKDAPIKEGDSIQKGS